MQEHDLRWAKSKEKWASVKNIRKKNTSIAKFNKESEIFIKNLSKITFDNTEFKLVKTLGSNSSLIGKIIKSKTMVTKTEINMRYHLAVSNLAIIDDEKKIIASAGENNTVYIWDFDKGSLINKFEVGEPEFVFCLAVLDDSSLVVSSSDETVGIWNTKIGKVRLELKGHLGGPDQFAFSKMNDLYVYPLKIVDMQ
jgi:WD40 repeat protein